MKSMTSQRVDELYRRLVRIYAQMPDVHPDSPEAAQLQVEVDRLQTEMQSLVPAVLAEGPWWGRAFLWCCHAVGLLTAPLVRLCHRLFHMVKGLL